MAPAGEMWSVVIFFFQAEDGIRDWSVTGVQTCALPISRRRPATAAGGDERFPLLDAPHRRVRDEPGPRVAEHFGSLRVLRRLDDAVADRLLLVPFHPEEHASGDARLRDGGGFDNLDPRRPLHRGE